MLLLIRSFVLTLLLVPMACSSNTTPDSPHYTLIARTTLDAQLGETSGLSCDEEGAITVNDSGNDPVLFQLNERGDILKQTKVKEKNHDWEAVTSDDKYYYVGDIGNNHGARKNLTVLKVDKTDWSTTARIAVNYDGYQPGTYERVSHDFDAEALVAHDGQLLLFSKSWATHKVHIYRLPHDTAQPSTVALKPVAEVTGLPGVVTGADWDEFNQRYVVVGYSLKTFGFFEPFMAFISEKFDVINTFPLAQSAQVEGVCVKDKHEIWYTQESAPLSTASLFRIRVE